MKTCEKLLPWFAKPVENQSLIQIEISPRIGTKRPKRAVKPPALQQIPTPRRKVLGVVFGGNHSSFRSWNFSLRVGTWLCGASVSGWGFATRDFHHSFWSFLSKPSWNFSLDQLFRIFTGLSNYGVVSFKLSFGVNGLDSNEYSYLFWSGGDRKSNQPRRFENLSEISVWIATLDFEAAKSLEKFSGTKFNMSEQNQQEV